MATKNKHGKLIKTSVKPRGPEKGPLSKFSIHELTAELVRKKAIRYDHLIKKRLPIKPKFVPRGVTEKLKVRHKTVLFIRGLHPTTKKRFKRFCFLRGITMKERLVYHMRKDARHSDKIRMGRKDLDTNEED